MSIEQIKNLPVTDWLDNDSMLWLWTTNSHLHEAFHCLEIWKLKYITTLTWVKTHFGLGYWLRGQTEHCLLGIKGKPRCYIRGPHGAIGSNWSTLVIAPRKKHSEKPQAFYDMVEEIGQPPRLEVFATKKRLGWDAIGDAVGLHL